MDDLEQLEQKLRSARLHTSKALDARVQAVLDEAEVGAPSAERRSLGRVLQKRIRGTIAVAAAAVLVVVGVTFLGKSAPMTLADVQKALEAQKWMHVRGEEVQTGGSVEGWYCFSPYRQGVRSSGGLVFFEDSQTQENHVYDPKAKTITVTHRSETPMDECASPVQAIKQAIEMAEEQGATLTRKKGERNGFPVEILDITHESVRVVLVCDRLTQLPIEMEGWTAKEPGDFVQVVSARFDYPDTGPTSIYDLGVPRDAKVVDLTPPQEAENLSAQVEAHRQNFATSYRAIICRGHVEGSAQYTDEINVIYKKGERCRIDVFHVPSVIGGPVGEHRPSRRIPAEDLAALEAWLATRPISESWFTETRRVEGGSVVTRVKRDVEGRLQKGPYEVPHADLVETLAWPRLRLEGEVRLLEPVESPLGDLVGLESATQGRMISPDSLRLPRRVRHYVNSARDYIVERGVDEARAEAPWQKDVRWAEGAAADQVSRSWSQSVEVLEYAQTSGGQWYPRKIHGPTETVAFITIVYVDTGRPIPDDVLDPDAVTSPDAYEHTGVSERAILKAIAEIDSRPEWPASPVDVARAYWEARKAKRYDEMAVLWPGTESWGDYCKDEAPTEYEFGEPQEQAGTNYVFAPYASRGYYEKHGTHNLKMMLSNERSAKGRYYIISGN